MTTETATEEKQETEVKDDVQETPAVAKKTEEHMIPKSRLDEINQKLADEKKRADGLAQAAIDKENEKLKEGNKYKELYENSLSEINTLKPKADALDTAEETLKAVLDAQIEQIPEEKRVLIPTYGTVEERLSYISANGDLLRKAQPFDIKAGPRGGKSDEKSVVLTDDEKKMADNTNVSYENYAKKIKRKRT